MTDKRIDKNIQSLLKLKELLQTICKNPDDFKDNDAIIVFLKSQGKLSSYENEDIGITKTSINTLKRISSHVFENGFEDLDKLRVKALETIINVKNNEISSNKQTKTGLSKRVEELEKQVETLRKDEYILLQSIMNTITELKTISHNKRTDDQKDLCEKLIRKLVSTVNSTENCNIEINNVVDLFKGIKK